MTIRTLAAFLFVSLLNFAVTPAAEQQDIKSFVYKRTKQTDLELVVHHPPGWKDSDERPAIVFFFGGGWTGGKIEQFEPQTSHLVRRGMVAARADYRVKTRHGATPKECVEDAKAAIRWLRAHAEKYQVDPERIGVTGDSAGGHLSLLVGLTDPSSSLEGDSGNPDQSSRVQAVVNVFGPIGMAFCYEHSSVAWILRLFLGGTLGEAAQQYKAADATWAFFDQHLK